MKAGIVIFPGINRERDMAIALERLGRQPRMLWHKETDLAGVDLVVIPGGFSFGDYLRCGAMAAHSPIMAAIRDHAARGGYVLGVCNGFQILTEAGMLPGALLRNAALRFLPGIATSGSSAPTRSSPRNTNARNLQSGAGAWPLELGVDNVQTELTKFHDMEARLQSDAAGFPLAAAPVLAAVVATPKSLQGVSTVKVVAALPAPSTPGVPRPADDTSVKTA